MKKLLGLILYISLITTVVRAQTNTPDTTSAKVSADTVFTDQLVQDTIIDIKKVNSRYPNPKKALLFAIVPGGGQIYNKRWWKLPLVYGAFGGMIYLIDYNQSRFRRLRDALDLKRADEPHEFSGTALDDLRTLRSLRDRYDKNTQLSYVGIFFVYVLQGMEAFVDAHLKSFDINDDLSIRVKPGIQWNTLSGQPAAGIGLTLKFHTPAKVQVRNFLLN